MLIYEIPYNSEERFNAFGDALHFIKSNVEDYCVVKIKPETLLLVFSEKYMNHFFALLDAYDAKKLDSVPPFDKATLIGGNLNLLLK